MPLLYDTERRLNPTNTYEHTQVGTGTIVFFSIVLAIILGTTAIGSAAKSLPLIFINATVMLVILVCCVIFSKMTISVGNGKVTWQLGYGLIRRQIAASEIRSCTPIQTSGFSLGLRMAGNRSLWIVSGRDAVALSLKNGKLVALGTPDKERLCGVISALIEHTKT